MKRKEFLEGMAATIAAFGWQGAITLPDDDETLPPWKPGNLDLHFIYTGCGENMFYRLPDGTTILNDVGDFYRPKNISEVPLLPNASRIGGDWVSRYIRRVYNEHTIDYALFSHWHTDHVGHDSADKPETPNAAYRWRFGRNGKKVNGLLCVAEDFTIARCLDHQFPKRGLYNSHDSSYSLFQRWVDEMRPAGLAVMPFKVGELNQIRMVHDFAKYKDSFSIRNIAANGVLWDGADGKVDLAAGYVAKTRRQKIAQNSLSMVFKMKYGKFSYLATGDLQGQTFYRPDGTEVDYETEVGKVIDGPVTVCKMGHHGCSNAMHDGIVNAACADAYVACMWCPAQAHPTVLDRLGNSLILPQLLCASQREWFAAHSRKPPHEGAVHVVVRVAEGGEKYRIYLLDAADEEMRIVAKFDRSC